jgi:hypothetical protein
MQQRAVTWSHILKSSVRISDVGFPIRTKRRHIYDVAEDLGHQIFTGTKFRLSLSFGSMVQMVQHVLFLADALRKQKQNAFPDNRRLKRPTLREYRGRLWFDFRYCQLFFCPSSNQHITRRKAKARAVPVTAPCSDCSSSADLLTRPRPWGEGAVLVMPKLGKRENHLAYLLLSFLSL